MNITRALIGPLSSLSTAERSHIAAHRTQVAASETSFANCALFVSCAFVDRTCVILCAARPPDGRKVCDLPENQINGLCLHFDRQNQGHSPNLWTSGREVIDLPHIRRQSRNGFSTLR